MKKFIKYRDRGAGLSGGLISVVISWLPRNPLFHEGRLITK